MIRTNWWTTLAGSAQRAFQASASTPRGFQLANLVFFQDADPLLVPVVDQDPEVPLSETEQITTFDGTRNYIDWLLTASEEELTAPDVQERRRRADRRAAGAALPSAAPRVDDAARGQRQRLLTRLRPELVSTTASTSIVNVGASKVVPTKTRRSSTRRRSG